MKSLDPIETKEDFQKYARFFIHEKVEPSEINWGDSDRMMFDETFPISDLPSIASIGVPKEYGSLVNILSMLRTSYKWNLLYKILYRLKYENKNLLSIPSDPNIREAAIFKKSISKDIHKMHAFVRFKRAPTDEESYIAWHRPEHLIMRAGTPFFVKRFGDKPWSILSPDESAHWDGRNLRFTEGVAFEDFKVTDDWDEIWKDYYRSIYNPARLNIKMMKQEMSPKYWQSLPESEIIEELIKGTPDMLESLKDSQWYEADVLKDSTLSEIQEQVSTCKACPLYEKATQAVPGIGPVDAKLVIVGEQPGDREDLEGIPFVGPAGEVLNQCLDDLGIKREEIYFTNTVKHFSFTENPQGGRIHKRPNGRQVHACKPWLEAELKQIKPKVIVALGVTAATALLGRKPNISNERGKIISTKYSSNTIVSWHPASILRSDGESRDRKAQQLLEDLFLAFELTK